MRPGQNKRMRGRNNNNNSSNNRKGPNPLTRSYESNGPDVKIRGTAHHVAEKYLQLARDAQSSGDPVAAESYLQHAEHYFRLIATAQQAQMGYARPGDDTDAEDGDEDDVNALPDRFASPPERTPPPYNPPPQPYADRQPYNGERPAYNNGERQPYNGERPAYNGERHPQQDRPERQDRPDRNDQGRGGYDRNARNDRTGRGPRPYRDQDGRPERTVEGRAPDQRAPEARSGEVRDAPRGEFNAPRMDAPRTDGPREPAPERQQPPERQPMPDRQPAARVETQRDAGEGAESRQPDPIGKEAPSLPAFITAPVRVNPMPVEALPEAAPNGHADAPIAEDGAPRFPRRRRRTTRAAVAEAGAGDAPDLPGILPVSND